MSVSFFGTVPPDRHSDCCRSEQSVVQAKSTNSSRSPVAGRKLSTRITEGILNLKFKLWRATVGPAGGRRLPLTSYTPRDDRIDKIIELQVLPWQMNDRRLLLQLPRRTGPINEVKGGQQGERTREEFTTPQVEKIQRFGILHPCEKYIKKGDR